MNLFKDFIQIIIGNIEPLKKYKSLYKEKLLMSNKYKLSHWFWAKGKRIINKKIMTRLTKLCFIIKVASIS